MILLLYSGQKEVMDGQKAVPHGIFRCTDDVLEWPVQNQLQTILLWVMLKWTKLWLYRTESGSYFVGSLNVLQIWVLY